VRELIVGGEIVVRNRRPTRIAPLALGAEAVAGAERLWATVAELG
jgi:hypothetical protein